MVSLGNSLLLLFVDKGATRFAPFPGSLHHAEGKVCTVTPSDELDAPLMAVESGRLCLQRYVKASNNSAHRRSLAMSGTRSPPVGVCQSYITRLDARI